MTGKKKNNTVLIILGALVLAGAVVYGYMKYLPEEAKESRKAAVSEDLLAKAQKAEQQGDADGALEYYQEFLEANAQPPDHSKPAVGTAHARMGNIFLKRLKYPKAIEHFKKALDHANQHIGKESQEAGDYWFSLASIYDKQGEVKTALEHYQNSRAIRAKLGGDTDQLDQVIDELKHYMVTANQQTPSKS